MSGEGLRLRWNEVKSLERLDCVDTRAGLGVELGWNGQALVFGYNGEVGVSPLELVHLLGG